MASTELQTVTQATTITHGRCLVLAGSRLYALLNDGSNLVYQYSDNDGVSWSSETTVVAGSGFRGSMVYDPAGRLNICYAGENTGAAKLGFRAITSNVTSGTPGALTSETVIDSGASSLGIQYPYMIHSDTVTNPRYWIIAKKWTVAGTTSETRAWYAGEGSNADTAGNWVNTNFTNLGGNSNSSDHKFGVAASWTVGGNDRVTLVFQSGEGPLDFEAVTFDPTAAPPTPGSVTANLAAHTGAALIDPNINGSLITINAKADYLVFGRYDPNAGTWSFLKTVDGTTWAAPNAGWTGLTMGRCQIAKSSGDFYLVHGESYGAIATSAQALKYRKLTASSDNMGGVTNFSDTNGNGVSVPEDTGTSKLYALYRGSIASPYTLRSDSVNIGGAADTTPPGQATISATVASGTQINVALVMPADIDVDQYEIRFLTGATAPATDRSDGTTAVAATSTTANATIAYPHTGLTGGTRYTYRVFVKDVAGNWNTGATATAVAATAPTFLQRYQSDGTTTVPDATTAGGNNMVLEYQLATTDFETAGNPAHFAFRIGYDNTTPPAQSYYDILSLGASPQRIKYEHPAASGTFVDVPVGGLVSTFWGRKLRIYTDTTQPSQFGSLQVRQ